MVHPKVARVLLLTQPVPKLRRAALPPMGQELPPLPHNLNAAQHLKILLIPFQEPLECKGSSPLVLAQSPCRKLETLSKSEGAAATLDAPIPVPVAPTCVSPPFFPADTVCRCCAGSEDGTGRDSGCLARKNCPGFSSSCSTRMLSSLRFQSSNARRRWNLRKKRVI